MPRMDEIKPRAVSKAPIEQVRVAAIALLHQSVHDSDGALLKVMEQDIRQEEALFGPLTQRLTLLSPEELHNHLHGVLGRLASRTIATEAALVEFTRRVDAMWGQLLGERPHFQRPGQEAHPDDPYTHDSVRKAMMELIELATKHPVT